MSVSTPFPSFVVRVVGSSNRRRPHSIRPSQCDRSSSLPHDHSPATLSGSEAIHTKGANTPITETQSSSLSMLSVLWPGYAAT